MRFGKNGKLSTKYIGPFEILDQIGPVVYKVALPLTLVRVHNVFHVSMLTKCIPDPPILLTMGHFKSRKILLMPRNQCKFWAKRIGTTDSNNTTGLSIVEQSCY